MCQSCALSVPLGAGGFETRLVRMINEAGLSLMIAIGHKTGLFDAMDGAGPVTGDALAERAGLNERYVREWLGAMATGGVVTHDGARGTYELPTEHAGLLTRRAAPSNMAPMMQWVAVLASAQDEIAECFRRGGGVPYAHYAGFHRVMAEESDQTVVSNLFEHILPLAPGMQERLAAGIRVADLGCGRAHALMAMAERFPKSAFVGVDLCEETIAWASNEARRRGLTNVRLYCHDATRIIEDGLVAAGAFDLVTTFDSVHDQARPDVYLTQIRRLLAPGGRYLMQDIGLQSAVADNMEHPLAPFIYTISCMHCMSVSLQQGGAGLGAAWGREKAAEMLAEAGFGEPELHDLEHDPMNFFAVAAV
ncbi:MAG: class I SAM-dependent methyltransferase [Planctomycetota bacterium]